MTKITTIEVDGIPVKIDSAVFLGYTQESHTLLRQIEILKEDFKYLVETVAETTNLDKKYVRKYLTARFKEETKDPKKQGELFEALDAALEA
jgi:hypothetical protein